MCTQINFSPFLEESVLWDPFAQKKPSDADLRVYRTRSEMTFLTSPESPSLQPPASAMSLTWPASAPLRCCKPGALALSKTSFLTAHGIAGVIQQVIAQKEANVQRALKGRANVSEAVMIGGDLFSMGYLGFQGVQIIKPSLSKISAVGITTLACGCFAGAINIGVALISLKEAIQAYKNGDTKLALRLFLDFFGLFSIGAVMILTSLAIKVAALAALGAFFAANPWLLPVLFFIITIPMIIEIGYRIKNITENKDLASELIGRLNQGKEDPFYLKSFLDAAKCGPNSHLFIQTSLIGIMEEFQAEMGVDAALEMFRLMRQVLLKESTEEQLARVKKKIAEWNRAQYVRMFQQILYAAAFGVSMAALKPSINIPAVNAAESFAMAGANAIPFYMDTFWPFKRNTPIVVPIVEV